MKDENALNIYLLSTRLLEELDKAEGTSIFRNKFKLHAKGMIKEIENFDKLVFNNDEKEVMMSYVTKKINELNTILE